MADGIEKRILALVAADLPHQKDRIKHNARNEQAEEDNAKHSECDRAVVQDEPPDLQRNRKTHKQDAQRDEEGDSSAASGNIHERC